MSWLYFSVSHCWLSRLWYEPITEDDIITQRRTCQWRLWGKGCQQPWASKWRGSRGGLGPRKRKEETCTNRILWFLLVLIWFDFLGVVVKGRGALHKPNIIISSWEWSTVLRMWFEMQFFSSRVATQRDKYTVTVTKIWTNLSHNQANPINGSSQALKQMGHVYMNTEDRIPIWTQPFQVFFLFEPLLSFVIQNFTLMTLSIFFLKRPIFSRFMLH